MALPDTRPDDRAAHERLLRVLSVGSSPAAHGGIGSVQAVLERTTGDAVALTTICTHRDGPALRRLTAMVIGVVTAVVRLLTDPPDVIHLHMSQRLSVLRKGLLLTVARWRGVPSVLHLHGSGFLDWYDGLPGPARRLVRAMLRPDRLVVLSALVRDECARRLAIPADHIVVLTNPVEHPAAVPAPPTDGTVTAAFLGRFGERKGIYDVVEALALLAPDLRARLRLVAAGDGEVAQVRDAVHEAGLDDVVTVHDWLDRSARDALLGRAELLLLPSSHEGLPMAVLEAMAWGVAPVVTAVGGMPEVVSDGGNGVLVPVHDPATLARRLAAVLSDDDARHALGARARIDSEVFGADRWADRLTDLWASVAVAPRG
jgi:glycosyltransferase involved in cell wall biosynthesis